MAKAGDKYVGELDFQRPDGEYDIWTIVKRLDPAVAGSRPKGYPIYLIGTATNSGLLSDYYYTPERGESESKSLEEISADLEVLARDGEKYMSRVRRIPKKGLRKNPPFYAHNLYEKKTHGLTLKQMRRLYAMVSRGNQKAITYARNVLGIPFSESPTQVKAVVYHHVRDLAERRVRRNGRRAFATPRFVGKGAHVWRQLRPSQRMNFLHTHFTPQITPRSQEILAGRSFQFLPKNVKMAVEAKYANMEPEEYLRENPLSYHVGGLSSLGARGEERRRMRLGKMEYSALEFARKYPGWHGFNPKNPTGKVIKSLAKKGLVEISNISNQFKII